jgi:hypothetical protein
MATVYADNYGFNKDDATKALQAAIDDPNADKIVVRNTGTPWLLSKSIVLKSNKEIDFEPDVVVQAKPGTFSSNSKPLFNEFGVDNVKLIGQGQGEHQAVLRMNKSEFTNTDNNQGSHIISVQGANNYTISGLKLTGAGGDGIYISGDGSSRTYSSNGLIDNVTSDHNHRQGMSIISAKDLVVQNSNFTNTSGVAPGSGIDFEPNNNTETLQNIKLKNINVSGNNGDGIQFALSNLDNSSPTISISIDGATINNNNSSGVNLGTFQTEAHPNVNDPSSTPNGTITISNSTIAGTKGTTSYFGAPSAGIMIQGLSGDPGDPNNLKLNFDRVNITDTGNGQFSKNPIFIQGFGGANNRQQIGNMSFKDVTVSDRFKRDIVGTVIGREDGYMNNVSGNITANNPNGVSSKFAGATPKNVSLTVREGNAASPVAPQVMPQKSDPLTGDIPIVNPSFNDKFMGWHWYNDPNLVSVANRPGGSNWADIKSHGGLGEFVTKDIVAGQHYTVGATALVNLAGDLGVFGVLFKNADGKTIDIESLDVTNTTAKHLQKSFTAPANFATAEIFGYKDAGKGDLFVGDFVLTKQ